jgi:hypothetical protein
MSESMKRRIEAVEEKTKPPEPIRIQVNMCKRIDDTPTREEMFFIENREARDARMMSRFQRGLISHDELMELCREPLPAGYYNLPECDFPLDTI